MIFFVAALAPCLLLNLRLSGAEEADRERRRIDKVLQAACDDTASDIIGFEDGRQISEYERAYEEFIKNFAVRLGIADDPASREELFRYVPCVIVACEEGIRISKLEKDADGELYVEDKPVEGEKEEALKKAIREGLSGVIEDYRLGLLAGELNLPEYAKTGGKGFYTANFSHALTEPSVIALIIGYPSQGLANGYSSVGISGSYLRETKGYYITEERSGLYYHVEESDCLIGKEALHVMSALEAAQHGARPCGRCFYNGSVAASCMPVSGR